jgi:hypothetical protein
MYTHTRALTSKCTFTHVHVGCPPEVKRKIISIELTDILKKDESSGLSLSHSASVWKLVEGTLSFFWNSTFVLYDRMGAATIGRLSALPKHESSNLHVLTCCVLLHLLSEPWERLLETPMQYIVVRCTFFLKAIQGHPFFSTYEKMHWLTHALRCLALSIVAELLSPTTSNVTYLKLLEECILKDVRCVHMSLFLYDRDI